MNEDGWISLHRKIKNHWLYPKGRAFSEYEAWLDILLEVNYSEKKVKLGNSIIKCGSGESLNSLETWARRWGWNKSKVRRFLKTLKSDTMIDTIVTQKTTHVSVINWAAYQNERNKDETKSDTIMKRSRNDGETIATPNNNNNKKNNINNTSKISEKFSQDSQMYKAAVKFYKDILKHDSKFKEPNFQKWADDIDKIFRIDKRSDQEVKEVYDFMVSDEFWRSNILSPYKFRKQFSQLLIKMEGVKNQTHQRSFGYSEQHKQKIEQDIKALFKTGNNNTDL